VEFSDFGCPFCAQFAADSYPDLHIEFVLSGRVRWIYIPFVLGIFPNGAEAASAGFCAGEQDRFWAMRERLYERQHQWRRAGPEREIFREMAAEAGLDGESFERCLESGEASPRIEHSNALAREAGIRATPTFLINGRSVEGALPPDHFRALLDWAVAAAQ
jgi:protein-disulfide isomerase